MRLVLIFHRFGPYHIARLRGGVSVLEDVVGLELSGVDNTYAWDGAENERLPIETVFPDQDTDSLSYPVVKERVYSHLDRLEPTVVVVPGWIKNGALAALSWCTENKVPAVLLSESTYQDHQRHVLKETIKRSIVALFSSALVGGHKHLEYLLKLGFNRDEIYFGYNIVDNDYFSKEAAKVRAKGETVREQMGLPNKYFLFCARFIEEKNLDRFLDAYQLYWSRDDKPWSLVLVGDGELRPSIEEKVATLDCRDDVYLPGFTQIDALPSYYGLASGFVLPSQVEPWGLVVNEAMASGLPVLVSDRCGSSELVHEGENGWVFSPDSIDEMSESMSRVANLSVESYDSFCQKSREVIANWGPDRFGSGLQQAAVKAMEKGPTAGGLMSKLAINVVVKSLR